MNEEQNNAGEVELLLSDVSAVEGKVINVLADLFGPKDKFGGQAWLVRNLCGGTTSHVVLESFILHVVNNYIKEVIRAEIDYQMLQHQEYINDLKRQASRAGWRK